MRPPAIRFDAPPDRSSALAWVTAVALLGAAAGWLLVAGSRALPTAAVPPSSVTVAAAATSVLPSATPRPAAARSDALSALASPDAAASAAARSVDEAPPTSLPHATAGAAEIETCGGGWAALDANGEIEGLARRLGELKRRARERTLAALSAAPDDFAHAAALWLGAPPAPDINASAAASSTARRDDTLVRLAQSSRDARVYALAFRNCGAACQMLSAAQWARLDPGNAVPWLHVAQAAFAQADAAGVDEAMYRLSLAQRSAAGAELTARVLEQLPTDDATLPGSAAFLAEVSAAQTVPPAPVGVAIDYCAPTVLQDANRWQVCAGIAEVLAMHSTRPAERRAGTAIGEALGWPAERLAELRAAQQAALAAADNALQPGADALGCAAARRQLAWLRASAIDGEAGTALPRR